MSNYDFATQSQKLAIEHENGNAIVSASAGAGKTFVVIERIIRLITQNKVDVDGVLAMTFTTLAASEMKEKLKTALIKEYNATGNPFIKEQIYKIPTASISTIHSFCADLLRKNFYLANLDANFKIIDEKEGVRLKVTAIDNVFDELYESEDKDFFTLLSTFKKGRSDAYLKEIVLKIYNFAENNSGLEDLRQKSIKAQQNGKEILISEIINDIKVVIPYYEKDFNRIADLYSDDLKRKAHAKEVAELLNSLFNATSEEEIISLYNEYCALKMPSTKLNPELNAIFKSKKDALKKYLLSIVEPLLISCEERIKKQNSGLLLIEKLLNLTERFASEYQLLKSDENAVDFNDIILKTGELLSSQEQVRKAVKAKYKYVFIDEYQDVNYLQENLINLISNDNVFAVGDSKQSIYAFRGCNPEFFIKKFDDYSKKLGGVAYSLDDNFRSASAILNSVNNVFNDVMTEKSCGLEYKNAQMKYGNLYQNYSGSVGLYLLDNENVDEGDEILEGVYSVSKNAGKLSKKVYDSEVATIVKLIENAVNTKYFDLKEKCEKSVSYGDICVLLRSTNSTLSEKLVEALLLKDIPVSTGGKKSIEGYPEIKVLINLVNAVCSVQDDISLASVLLHFYNFNESELAVIRKATSKKTSLYKSLKNYSQKGLEQSFKVQQFLDSFDKIRLLSAYSPAGEIINKLISQSGYDCKILSSTGGERKLRRIERFISESYSGEKAMNMQEFYRYLQNASGNLSISESTGEDTVQIMTFHASKGLEFPVVILGGLSKNFNSQDLYGSVILDKDYGVAPKSFDYDKMLVSSNDVREIIKLKYKKQRAVEEARLMYVAMTRAKCQLHMVARKEDVSSERELLKVLTADCPADFLCELDGKIASTEYNEIVKLGSQHEEVELDGKVDERAYNVFKKELLYNYPHIANTTIPVKASVSGLSSSDERYETTDLFGESSSIKGTLYHAFLQNSSFDENAVEEELQNMLNENIISSSEIELLDVGKLKSILKMPIFDRIRALPCKKEQKFCTFVSASEIGYENATEEVLIQGIIDLMVEEGDEIILIDYKLSTILKDEDLVKAYKKQLGFYKLAIEKITKKKVKECYLINILSEKCISVELQK